MDLYVRGDDPAQEFAVKTFQIKAKESVGEIMREVQFMRELDICNNIVQLH